MRRASSSAAWGVWAISLMSCGARQIQSTRVARVEAVLTDDVESTRFFRDVYDAQIAVNEAAHHNRVTLRRLARALDLGETADLETCATALRSRANELDRRSARLVVRVELPATDRADAPADEMEAAVWPLSLAVAVRFLRDPHASEQAVAVTVLAEGPTVLPSDTRLATALADALRRAQGLRLRMDALTAAAPDLRARGAALHARLSTRPPSPNADALRNEYRDALDFVDGLAGRAAVEAQYALQLARRTRSSAATAHSASDEDLQKISTR